MPSETPKFDRERPLIVERPQVLQQIVESIDPEAALSSPDRVSCLDEQLFLRSVLRTPDRPIREIVAILENKLKAPRISEARRSQITDHLLKLKLYNLGKPIKSDLSGVAYPALPLEPVDTVLSGSRRIPEMVRIDPETLPVSSSVDPHGFDDDERSPTTPINRRPTQISEDTSLPAVITMPQIEIPDAEEVSPADLVPIDDDEEPILAPASLQAGPSVEAAQSVSPSEEAVMEEDGMAGYTASYEPLVEMRGNFDLEERAAEAEKVYQEGRGLERLGVEKLFSDARENADRYVQRAYGSRRDRESVLEAVSGTATTVVEAGYELETWDFPLELVRIRPDEAFFVAYFDGIERAGEHASAFRHSVREYVVIRARLAALMRFEAKLEPEDVQSSASAFELLGVAADVDRDRVESVFLGRMVTLDPDRDEDAHAIKLLQEARDLVLVDVEQRELAAVAAAEAREREAPQQTSVSEAPEEVSRPEITDTEQGAVTGSEVSSVSSPQQAGSRFVDALRAPGRIIRNLFFGGAMVAGAGAGIVALHEFAEKNADPMHDVGHDYSLGVIPGPFDGVNVAALFPEAKAASKPTEVPVDEIRLVPHGSWILKETGAMLRERGLRPTPQLTSYFSHLIEAVNAEAIVAAGGANRLPDNFPLIVTPIAAEMDQMAGIAPAASESSVVSKGGSEKSSFASGGSSMEKVQTVSPERVVPTFDSPMRVMAKGEYLGKVTHSMLRAGGLNWTTARINQLNDMVWQTNLPLFERLVQEGKMRKLKPEYIPIGVELDFSSAAQEVQRLVDAKKRTKKGG